MATLTSVNSFGGANEDAFFGITYTTMLVKAQGEGADTTGFQILAGTNGTLWYNNGGVVGSPNTQITDFTDVELRSDGIYVNNAKVSGTDGRLYWKSDLNENGTTTDAFRVQTVGAGANSGTISVSMGTVIAVNDAPVNTTPVTQSTTEDVVKVFSSANSNAITVSDAADTTQAGAVDYISTTVSVSHGLLTAVTTGAATVSNNGTASVTISGTAAQVNLALNGLSYAPVSHFFGADTLTITSSDGGYNGTGGVKTDVDTVTINVAAVNNSPVNTVPVAQATDEDTVKVFSAANSNAITVSDAIDTAVLGATDALTTTVSVSHGTLTAIASGAVITNNGTASVTIAGTAAQVNAALDGLSYAPDLNYNGSDTLTVSTNDNGNTGGGALTDTDTIAINIAAINDAPVNSVPVDQSLAPATTTLTFSSGNGNAITVSDVEAGTIGMQTVISVTSGATLTVTQAGGASVSGNGTNAVTISGTSADINATLNGLVFNKNGGLQDANTITVVTSDLGTAGAGGVQTDTDAIQVTSAPVVMSVTSPTAASYNAGDILEFTVIFDANVVVTGTPTLALTLDSGTVNAVFDHYSGPFRLTFSYVVASGNTESGNGITVGAINLNGGSIKSVGGSDAVLTLTGVASNSGVIVDTTAPTVTSGNITVGGATGVAGAYQV